MEATFDKVAKELDLIAHIVNAKYSPEVKGSSSSPWFFAVVSSLVSGTVSTFRTAVSQWLPSEQTEVQQLALLYHVAAVAVQQVGYGTDKAELITELTADYACEQYGSYIVANGGLETFVKQP